MPIANDTLPGCASKLNLKVAAEKVVALGAHTMNREIIPERPEGARYDVFGGKPFSAGRTAVHTPPQSRALAWHSARSREM